MNLNLYYAVNCGKKCDFYTKDFYEEEWKPAKLYDDVLTGHEVSNMGAIKKDGEFVNRTFTPDGEFAVKIGTKLVEVYKIVASTFLERPADGYEDKNGDKKHVHHYDNNSYNFIPDNMKFADGAEHKGETHLYLSDIKDHSAWDEKIKQICAKK